MHATKLQVLVRPRDKPKLVKLISKNSGAENLMSVGCAVGNLRSKKQHGAIKVHALERNHGPPLPQHFRIDNGTQLIAHRATRKPWPLARPASTALLLKV
jgi:hypothetical protein